MADVVIDINVTDDDIQTPFCWFSSGFVARLILLFMTTMESLFPYNFTCKEPEQQQQSCDCPHVSIFIPQVVETEHQEEAKTETPPANAAPQCRLYSVCIYIVTITMTLLSNIGSDTIKNKTQSLSKTNVSSFLILITIASILTSLLASTILLLARCFFPSRMKDIHYTLWKSVGFFFALLGLYSESLIIILPSYFKWWVYLIIAISFLVVVSVYYLIWNFVCRYQHKPLSKIWTFDWTFFLGVLPGILNVWLHYLPPTALIELIITIVSTFLVFVIRCAHKLIKNRGILITLCAQSNQES